MNFASCSDENRRLDLRRSYREGRISLSTSLLLRSLPVSVRLCLLLFLSFLFNFPYFLFFSIFLLFFFLIFSFFLFIQHMALKEPFNQGSCVTCYITWLSCHVSISYGVMWRHSMCHPTRDNLKNVKFRLSRNSTKFGCVTRFRETNPTA